MVAMQVAKSRKAVRGHMRELILKQHQGGRVPAHEDKHNDRAARIPIAGVRPVLALAPVPVVVNVIVELATMHKPVQPVFHQGLYNKQRRQQRNEVHCKRMAFKAAVPCLALVPLVPLAPLPLLEPLARKRNPLCQPGGPIQAQFRPNSSQFKPIRATFGVLSGTFGLLLGTFGVKLVFI